METDDMLCQPNGCMETDHALPAEWLHGSLDDLIRMEQDRSGV